MSRLSRIPLLVLVAVLLTGLLLTGQPAAAPPDDKPAPRPAEPAGRPAISDAAHAPFLEKAWSQPTLRENSSRTIVLEQAPKSLANRNLPVLGAFRPIATGSKVIYRSFWGVHAVDLTTGKLDWEAGSRWNLDGMLAESPKASYLNQWLNAYNSMNQGSVVLDNSLLGSLSTDGKLAFAVDDLIVGPFVNPLDGSGMANYGPPVSDALNHSCLQAFDLATGKLMWEQGDRAGSEDFKNTHFLGAPLVHDGRLYVLNEKESRLRLLCLDAAKGTTVWQLDLASFRNKASQDPQRRRHVASPVIEKGIIVCPTNAGSVVGIDLASRTLLWAYTYKEADPRTQPFDPNNPDQPRFPVQPNFQASRFAWKATPPRVAEGRVVYAAPDGQAVECFSLIDGSPVWKVKASQDDVYLADVYAGKAVVVGRKAVRALNLADGKTAWSVETGEPSGHGVRAGGVYYLPLRAAAGTKEPEVVAIDLAKGQVIAHAPSRKKEVPGNLFLHDGYVLSQTTGEIAAYPQLQAKLSQIDRLLGANPKDPAGLTERGELRLAKGDLQGAVDDLQTALAAEPAGDVKERARRMLHEAFTEFASRDFAGVEKYLAEFEKLCEVPIPDDATEAERAKLSAERKRRKSDFLFLKARGREQQGKGLDALSAYLDFLALGRTEEVIISPDDGSLRAPRDVLVGGRVGVLLARTAAGQERKAMEELIAQGWKKIEEAKDVKAAERFVRVFGVASSTGREARLKLARTLADNKSFSDAELHLLQVAGQSVSRPDAARALEALGGLYLRQELLEDAAHCYWRLNDEFGSEPVSAGKTGAEVFKEVRADKRLVPFLDPPTFGKVKVSETRGVQPSGGLSPYYFENDGDALPYFKRFRPALDVQQSQFKLFDRTGAQSPWTINVQRTNFQNMVYNGNPQQVRQTFRTAGHVVVVPIAQMIYGLDPVNRKVLWEKNLFGGAGVNNIVNMFLDPRDGAMLVQYPDGFQQRVGQLGPVDVSQVCILSRDGLTAIEPLTGAVVWSRSDVTANAQAFGDGEHVFLIEAGADGKPTGTRVFRSSDGAAVAAPDFSDAWSKQQGRSGRVLLLVDEKKSGPVLRAYDVVAGKDVWTREFPAGSVPLRGLTAHLAGAVDREGKATVLEIATGKEVMNAQVEPKYVEGVQLGYVWRDDMHVYVGLKGKGDGQPQPNPGLPAFMAGSGVRQVPLNGMLYAFEHGKGTLNWRSDATNQTLLLDPLQNSPVMWFAGWQVGGSGPNRNYIQGIGVRVIDKRTGKYLFDQHVVNQNQQLHALVSNPLTGSSELLGVSLKVTATVER